MPQLFQPRADAIFRFVLWTMFLGVVTGVVTMEGLSHSGWLTGRGMIEAQPTEFSHQHHAGELGIDCRYCHTSVETAATAGMPPTHTCMTCHSQIWTDARMLAPVRESLATNTPLHWKRVGRLPEYVYFDHCRPRRQWHRLLDLPWRHDARHADDLAAARFLHGVLPVAAIAPRRTSCARGMRSSTCSGSRRPTRRKRGKALLAQYHINTSGLLTDCSTCHR